MDTFINIKTKELQTIMHALQNKKGGHILQVNIFVKKTRLRSVATLSATFN